MDRAIVERDIKKENKQHIELKLKMLNYRKLSIQNLKEKKSQLTNDFSNNVTHINGGCTPLSKNAFSPRNTAKLWKSKNVSPDKKLDNFYYQNSYLIKNNKKVVKKGSKTLRAKNALKILQTDPEVDFIEKEDKKFQKFDRNFLTDITKDHMVFSFKRRPELHNAIEKTLYFDEMIEGLRRFSINVNNEIDNIQKQRSLSPTNYRVKEDHSKHNKRMDYSYKSGGRGFKSHQKLKKDEAKIDKITQGKGKSYKRLIKHFKNSKFKFPPYLKKLKTNKSDSSIVINSFLPRRTSNRSINHARNTYRPRIFSMRRSSENKFLAMSPEWTPRDKKLSGNTTMYTMSGKFKNVYEREGGAKFK